MCFTSQLAGRLAAELKEHDSAQPAWGAEARPLLRAWSREGHQVELHLISALQRARGGSWNIFPAIPQILKAKKKKKKGNKMLTVLSLTTYLHMQPSKVSLEVQ